MLGTPEPGRKVTLLSFASDVMGGDIKITGVELLGRKSKIKFKLKKGGLNITVPSDIPAEEALVFRINKTGKAKLTGIPPIEQKKEDK